MRLFADSLDYPLRPEHIDTTSLPLFMGSWFGKIERETSAWWITRFCQERGHWQPFTRNELQDFCVEAGLDEVFDFNQLDADGWLVLEDEHYRITHKFVVACFQVSPNNLMVALTI